MGPASASHKTSAVVIKTYISFSFEAEDDGGYPVRYQSGFDGVGSQWGAGGHYRGFSGICGAHVRFSLSEYRQAR